MAGTLSMTAPTRVGGARVARKATKVRRRARPPPPAPPAARLGAGGSPRPRSGRRRGNARRWRGAARRSPPRDAGPARARPRRAPPRRGPLWAAPPACAAAPPPPSRPHPAHPLRLNAQASLGDFTGFKASPALRMGASESADFAGRVAVRSASVSRNFRPTCRARAERCSAFPPLLAPRPASLRPEHAPRIAHCPESLDPRARRVLSLPPPPPIQTRR